MKRLVVFAALLAAAVMMCPQMRAQTTTGTMRRGRVQTVDGRAMGGQTITVCNYNSTLYALTSGQWTYDGPVPCTPAITVDADPALTQAVTPPLLTDSQGSYSYALAAGNYTECVTGSNITGMCYAITIGGTGSGSGGGAVSSVANSDGSLIVGPATGNVVVSLNTGHSNIFLAPQAIDPVSTSLVPLSVNAPSGEIGDIFDFELNATKEAWMDSAGAVHFAQGVALPSGSSLAGNASTASALQATPTQCAALQVSTGVQANGNANCTSFGGGVVTLTASTTLSLSNNGQFVTVDCASACTITLPNPVPASFFNALIFWSAASGASQVTIAPNGLELTVCTTTSTSNYNIPIQGDGVYLTTDGTNYFAGCPLVAGTNVTMTPTATGLSVTASTTASTAFSSLTPGTNTNAGFVIAPASDLGVELTINGPTAQTSDLQDWNINNGNLARVDHTGVLHAVGTAAGTQGVTSGGPLTVTGLSTFLAQVTVQPTATGTVSAAVTGPTGLTADLFDWLIGGTKYDWIDSSGAFHFASAPVMPAGSVRLDQIGAPVGPWTINNGGYSGSFVGPGAELFELQNSTAATSGANQNSPFLKLTGSCWNGSATAWDYWTAQDVVASGASANSALTFAHAQGCGGTNYSVNAPNFSTGGQFISTLASGTPPLVVASTTQVANLDAATAGAFDHTPMQCSGAQVAQGINASGSANCVTPAATSVITTSTNYYVCSQANGTTCGSTDTGNLWHGNATVSTTIADTNNCTAVATPCRTLAGVYAKLDPSVPLATQHVYVADNANTDSDCQSPNKMVWSGSTFGLMPMTQSSRLDTWPASYIDIHGNDTTPANVTVDPACGVTTQGAESAIDFDGPMAARVHGFQFIGYGKASTNYGGYGSGPLIASGGAHLYADNNIYTGDAGSMSSGAALSAMGKGSVVAVGGSQTDTYLQWLLAAYGGTAFTYDPDDSATNPTTLSFTCPSGDSCAHVLTAGADGTIYRDRLYATVNGAGTFGYEQAYLRGMIMYSEIYLTGDCTGAGYTAGSGKCNNFVTASTINAGNFKYADAEENGYIDDEAGTYSEGACTLNVTPTVAVMAKSGGTFREYSTSCLPMGGSAWDIESGGQVSLFTATYKDYSTGAADVPAIQNELMQKSDFTTANASGFQTIGSLSWTVPASLAQSIPFTCHLIYSQATPVSDSFGIQVAGNAPTRVDAEGKMFTSLTALTFGNLADLTTTTATAIVTATPTVASTLGVDMSGVIQVPSNTTTSAVNFVVSQSTAADVIVVKAGSYCKLN